MGYTWYASRTYSHCFLVLPLFLFLVWTRRRKLAHLTPEPDVMGLPVIALLAFAWLLANLGEARVAKEFALVGMLVALVWTLLGRRVIRAMAFPLAFLFFAVPFGLGLIGPLQDFTASFALRALTLSNVPAVLDGRTISLPAGVWTVAEACSGIRYLYSSLVVGTIYASLIYRSRLRKVLFVCASILVPIVANGARAYGIILLAYLSNNRLANGVDHVVYGGVFFVAVQIALFVVGLRWREDPLAEKFPARQRKWDGQQRVNDTRQFRRSVALVLAVVVLTSPVPLLAQYLWTRAVSSSPLLDSPASVSPPWERVAEHDLGWTPVLAHADSILSEAYRSANGHVDVYMGQYSGRSAMEFVQGYNRFENPQVWTLASEGFADATVDGHRVLVRRGRIQSNSTSRTVYTWYGVGGEFTASATRVKLLQGKARLLGKSPAAVVIMLGVDTQGASPADEVLQQFLGHTVFCTASE
jgi:exosortase A